MPVDYTLVVYNDRFTSLAAVPKEWLLFLPISASIAVGSILTVKEVFSDNVPTGRYMTGVCCLSECGAFYSYPPAESLYLFNQKSSIMTTYLPALVKSNTPQSVTGTTVATILYSLLIPAGSFSKNDFFRMYARFQGSNTAGSKSFGVWFNSSSSLSGATKIATFAFGNASGASGYDPFVRTMAFQNSLSSQVVANSAASVMSDETLANTNANSSLSINFAIDQYFIVSAQLTTGTDTATLLSMYGYIVR